MRLAAVFEWRTSRFSTDADADFACRLCYPDGRQKCPCTSSYTMHGFTHFRLRRGTATHFALSINRVSHCLAAP